MASSSTSSIRENMEYHVFLSFRGEDTRTNFVDHLYNSFKRSGIHAFRDNEELKKGKQLDQLFKAIEKSKFHIIVFSPNYASSSWCLNEVTKIMECQDGNDERIAFPIFYKVEASDIRKRSGPIGRAIAEHKTTKEQIEVEKWEKALKDAGNLSGWDLKGKHEAVVIDEIVREISVGLRSINLSKDENLVGVESQMKDLELALGIGLNDEARMIVMKGMGGIGKTTLARAIFNKCSSHFQGKSFVQNVREDSKARGGLLSLQQKILKDVLEDDSMKGVQDLESMAELRLPLKKVLIVLDDVDHKDQLEALAGKADWFQKGSRIIVTTRDEKVLPTDGWNMIPVYVKWLSEDEAMKLFSRYAFNRCIPDEGYEKLSSDVVQYAAGLPLTLKVLGSHLCREEKLVWIDAIDRLKTIPWKQTLDVLKISYDGLEDDHQKLFLDVACFMKGLRQDDAIRILKSCGFHPKHDLRVLEQKSLVTISNQRLSMHDSIEELGRDLVRRSHRDEPYKHSRLWDREEIEELLSEERGTEATTCIRLEPVQLSPEIIMKGLRNLTELRVLMLLSGTDDNRSHSNRMTDQVNFPNALKFLNWEGYPFKSLPQTFRGNKLVGLELPNSRIVQLWERGERKVLEKLKFLDLSYSKLKTLDLSAIPKLEWLELKRCYGLTKLHVLDGCLKELVYLNLVGCSSFKSFSFIKKLESLELFCLPMLEVFVESLDEFPRYSRDNLPKLRFTCSYLEVKEQPSSIAKGLKSVFLDLQPGTKLESVSGSICGLKHLTHLKFHGPIPELPNDLDQLANLEELNLVSTHIECLPGSICMLKHLKSLKLESCELLEKLPKDLGKLESLKALILTECKSLGDIPNSIGMMNNLICFHLTSCDRVKKLPEELGLLKCLRELNVKGTEISHLPKSISSLEGLCIFGSISLLQSCVSATAIQTLGTETFRYIQAVNNTPAPTENHRKRNFADHEATNTRGDST